MALNHGCPVNKPPEFCAIRSQSLRPHRQVRIHAGGHITRRFGAVNVLKVTKPIRGADAIKSLIPRRFSFGVFGDNKSQQCRLSNNKVAPHERLVISCDQRKLMV